MKRTAIQYVIEGTGGELYASDATGRNKYVESVSIDSRKIEDKCLFFCIIGERSDAHTFLPQVREAGCRNIVVSNREWADRMKSYGDMNIILTDDTTMALVSLATRYMDDWSSLRKVAVTGSVGKTSTKEFLYCVLSEKFKTEKTPGNLNSEFGIPLTVFGFDEDIEAAVIEIGLGYGPDMKVLANIVKPDAGVVTTIGSSHLEVFGTREKLLEAKLRITTGFGPENTLVVNSDCDMLKEETVRSHTDSDFRLISVGHAENSDYRISAVCDLGVDGVKCNIEHRGKSFEMKLPVIGAHNLMNAAEAVAIGGVFGIDTETAIRALGKFESVGNRLDVMSSDRFTVINDTYNASPESMKAGIDIVMNSKASRYGAILGDMFELGDDSEALHASVGTYAAEKGIDFIITIGENSLAIAEAARTAGIADTVSYKTVEEAAMDLENVLRDGDLILVKASNAMGLSRISRAIIEL